MELAVDACLLDARLAQPLLVACKAVDDEEQHQQTREYQDHIAKSHALDGFKHFVVVIHQHHLPVGIFLQRREVDGALRLVFGTYEFSDFYAPAGFSFRTIVDKIHNLFDVVLIGTIGRRSHSQLSLLRQHQSERRGIVVHGIDGVAKPCQVDVESTHRRHVAFRVEQGVAVGGELLVVFTIDIGVAPELAFLA